MTERKLSTAAVFLSALFPLGLTAGCGGTSRGPGDADGEETFDGDWTDGDVGGDPSADEPGLEEADACAIPCGSSCCAADELCREGGRCVRDLGPCDGDDDCRDDSWCDQAIGRCVPYGVERDRSTECRVPLEPGIFRTRIQCEWTGPPEGDPYPDHVNASSMPLVVDFGIWGGHETRPSIVVVTGPQHTSEAILRVLDGATCEQQATLEDYSVNQGSTPAVGDLDGDTRPEIVAPLWTGGGVAAWTWDEGEGAFRLLWRSTDTTASGKSFDITLADLDDDGSPEVLCGAVVYSAGGEILSASAGLGDLYCSDTSYVAPAVVADVDLDDWPELVLGSGLWAWNDVSASLVPEPVFGGAGLPGPVAVADFGDFPGRAGDAPGRPEIVSIRHGQGALMTIGGDIVFGPFPFPGTGDGGNPTIADFDGDGQPEFATAGYSSYTVFDPDCTELPPRDGACGSGRTDGILWSRPIEENSCAIMGSTVFDFEGDGAAEAVYADECFARVFDGRDGTVVWSRQRSSATWVEGPTVADVDGDFHAEMVLTATDEYHGPCPALDPIFPGLRCSSDADCPTGDAGSCVASLCRCEVAEDCGDPELVCTAPIDGTEGAGNVCRSTFTFQHGVRVYADTADRWAGSRAIWNQHAYSVTNVDDDGTIPSGSAVKRNWEIEGLNNFRQNVQGDLELAAATDLTVTGVGYGRECTAEEPDLELVASVCNRGSLGVPPGVVVVFYDGDPAAGGVEVCRAATTGSLGAAECEEVSCIWSGPPIDTPLDMTIAADPEGEVSECLEGNNLGTLEARCPPPLV